MDPDDASREAGPFSNPTERQAIRSATVKAEKMWPFLAPFVAVAENKKAVVFVAAAVAGITWLTRPDIAAAVQAFVLSLSGGAQ